jgi:hypothetical protein
LGRTAWSIAAITRKRECSGQTDDDADGSQLESAAENLRRDGASVAPSARRTPIFPKALPDRVLRVSRPWRTRFRFVRPVCAASSQVPVILVMKKSPTTNAAIVDKRKEFA